MIRLAAVLLLLAAAGEASAARYRCPPALRPGEAAVLPSGWWKGERAESLGAPRKGPRRLSEIWVVAGRPGAELSAFPAILKPEGTGYDLAAETGGVVLACLYGGSRTLYATALPDGVRSCRLPRRGDRGRRLVDRIDCT